MKNTGLNVRDKLIAKYLSSTNQLNNDIVVSTVGQTPTHYLSDHHLAFTAKFAYKHSSRGSPRIPHFVTQ